MHLNLLKTYLFKKKYLILIWSVGVTWLLKKKYSNCIRIPIKVEDALIFNIQLSYLFSVFISFSSGWFKVTGSHDSVAEAVKNKNRTKITL